MNRSELARMPTVRACAPLSVPAAGSRSAKLSPDGSVTPFAAARPSTRFIGGSLKARATRIDCGRWKTSAVGPYCSSSPASSTAV